MVFFCNSGAEAMEGVIKVVRRYQFSKGHPERYRLITFEGAFHGRTLGTLAATGSAEISRRFRAADGRLRPGAARRSRSGEKGDRPHTAGILIEPVQGEGGVRSAPQSFFKALRQLCDEHGLLLAFDEVQTGMGRTGDLFAYKRVGVTPDVMSLAKALGGGFPIGAVLATAEAASRHDARFARLDLRRQSAGDIGGQCGARRDAQARLLRSRAEDVAAA